MNRIVDNNIRMTEAEFKRCKGSGWCFVAFGKVGEIEGICLLRDVIKNNIVALDMDLKIGFAFKTGDVLRWVAMLDDPENLIEEWVDQWVDQTEKMTQKLKDRIATDALLNDK